MSKQTEDFLRRMRELSPADLIARVRAHAKAATVGPLVPVPSPRAQYPSVDLLTERNGAPVLEHVLLDDAPFHAEARELALVLCEQLEVALKRVETSQPDTVEVGMSRAAAKVLFNEAVVHGVLRIERLQRDDVDGAHEAQDVAQFLRRIAEED